MADRVAEMRAQGRKLIGLQTGDPDFATPASIMDAALNAMHEGYTHYVPSRGTMEMRCAISEKLLRTNAVQYDPNTEILVTHGGVHAYYCAMASIINPGDEVLIPDPCWATHSNIVVMLRGKTVGVPATAENGFIPLMEAWEAACSSRTRAMVINWPNNPTGAIASKSYLTELAAFAMRHNLWIVSDEVYENLTFDGIKHTSVASIPDTKARTLIVNSLSKTYAMTGWRVGYLTAPADVINQAIKVGQNSITCVAPFIQKAAAFALTDAGIQDETLKMRSAYSRRRDLVVKIAHEHLSSPVRVTAPQGAFYFFLDMHALGMSSTNICERLLNEKSVALVPGAAFGACGEGFVRMTIAAADADITTGIQAILDWADHVN